MTAHAIPNEWSDTMEDFYRTAHYRLTRLGWRPTPNYVGKHRLTLGLFISNSAPRYFTHDGRLVEGGLHKVVARIDRRLQVGDEWPEF
jgi:hypothetical protein